EPGLGQASGPASAGGARAKRPISPAGPAIPRSPRTLGTRVKHPGGPGLFLYARTRKSAFSNAPLEGNVVVDVAAEAAAAAAAAVLLGRGRRLVAAAAAAAATAAAEEADVVGDDLGGVALVAVLVFPGARLDAPLDVGLAP